MKNILIVTAHPSNTGLTHKIAEAYQTESEKFGHKVTLLNLYAPENKLPNLAFEGVKNWPKSAEQDRMKNMIAEADELVFVHPMWWGSAPAILKNWIDTLFEAGFAFRYGGGGRVDKLFTKKTAKIFATSGGPAFIFLFPFYPFRSFWKRAVLGFCGVKVTEIAVLGSTDSGTSTQKASRLEKFLNRVRRSATK